MGVPTADGRAADEQRLEQRLELLEALPDAVLLIDDEARLRWGNAAAAELFGRTLEASIGMSGLDFVHPDDLQLVLVSMVSMQHKDTGSLLEVRIRGPHGWRLTEVLGTRVHAGLLIVMRDVTERRRWEVAGDETARFRSLLQNGTSITMLLDGDGLVGASSGGLTRLLGLDQQAVE